MSKKPSQLKSDKFTIFITPFGKAGQLPDMKFTYNNDSKYRHNGESVTFKEIREEILSLSRNLKNMTRTQRAKWDAYYDK